VDGDRTQLLLVDLGGVLFSFDHEHRLNVLGDCLGLPPGQVDELLWQSGFSASCDAGRYRDAAAVRAQIRRITGYAGPGEDLDTAWCSAFRPDPDVTGLLGRSPCLLTRTRSRSSGRNLRAYRRSCCLRSWRLRRRNPVAGR